MFQAFDLHELTSVSSLDPKVFAQANIKTFEDLGSDPHRIERLLSRNPPFGSQLCTQIQAFPKFSLDLTSVSSAQ